MKTYQDWNRVLATYFLQGVPHGSSIYLSLDDAVLEVVAQQEFKTSPLEESFREDFTMAVRQQIVRENSIELDIIKGYDGHIPKCVAFLGVCVLAAYDMKNEEEINDAVISEKNYFTQLRKILQIPGSGRPPGLRPGSIAEEPLWVVWNQWLREQDYLPTAKKGKGSNKFINYPISQCLLRQADRNRLTRYFHEQCWTHAWDSQTLFSRLRAKPKQFPEYLCNLIKNSGDRHEVLAEAIHEVHQQWIEAGCPPIDKNQSQRILTPSSNLFAGLYRSEEDNEITYYLYPKQKPQQKTEGITVEYQGETEQLEIDRPGWYLPIDSPINQIALDKGIRCKILESDFLKTLQLPARDFWILIPDPDEPDSGVYASWCTPRLGQSFILLCKQKLLKDLHLLKDERLVNWSNEVNPFGEENKQWLELHNFQVISQAWRGIFIENWELKDALQPKVNLSISLSGGLRTPNQNAWLQGYTPNITIFGFMKNVELEVLKFPEQQRVKYHEKIETNKPYTLQLNECDSCLYLIRAIHNSYIAEVSLRIVEYDSLQLHKAENLVQNLQKVKLLNDHKICGGVIY